MIFSDLAVLKVALLGGAAFLFGIFGISAATHTPIREILLFTTSSEGREMARACMLAREEEEEVFFLSCGGIY